MSGESFFDFRKRLTSRVSKPAAQRSSTKDRGEAMTVAQLTGVIDRAIKSGLPTSVLVKGEVSNVNIQKSSGHIYFTMKDATACIDCVIWASDVARLRFKPVDGSE